MILNAQARHPVGAFRDRAAVHVRQPFANPRLGVIHLVGRLQVQDDDGLFADAGSREVIGAQRVSRHVAEQQVDVVGVEVFARCVSFRFRIDQPEVVNLGDAAHPLRDEFVVADQPFAQPFELIPVARHANRIQPDTRFLDWFNPFQIHKKSSFSFGIALDSTAAQHTINKRESFRFRKGRQVC